MIARLLTSCALASVTVVASAAAQDVHCVFDVEANKLVEAADPSDMLRVEVVKQDAVLWHWAPQSGTDMIGIVQCDGMTGAGTMGAFPSSGADNALAMAARVLAAQPDPLKRQMLAVRTFFREEARKQNGKTLSTSGEQGRCACLAAGLPAKPQY